MAMDLSIKLPRGCNYMLRRKFIQITLEDQEVKLEEYFKTISNMIHSYFDKLYADDREILERYKMLRPYHWIKISSDDYEYEIASMLTVQCITPIVNLNNADPNLKILCEQYKKLKSELNNQRRHHEIHFNMRFGDCKTIGDVFTSFPEFDKYKENLYLDLFKMTQTTTMRVCVNEDVVKRVLED